MSSVKRLEVFRETVKANHLIPAKLPAFTAYYNRVFLTRRVAEFVLSALIVFGGHQLIIINNFFSPIWPAAGVALALLFLRGNALLAGIFVGTISSYLYNHLPLLMSLRQALAFILVMMFIRSFSLKWIGSITPLFSLKTFWLFVLVCALACAAHISLMGLLFVQANHSTMSWFGWGVAFLGELNGILCVTPLCFVFDPFVLQNYFGKKHLAWQIACVSTILVHLLYFFISSTMSIFLSVSFLILLCGYAAYFGLLPLCVTVAGLSIIYLAGALPQAHLFHSNSSELSTFSIISLFTLSILLSLHIAITKQRNYYEKHKIMNNA